MRRESAAKTPVIIELAVLATPWPPKKCAATRYGNKNYGRYLGCLSSKQYGTHTAQFCGAALDGQMACLRTGTVKDCWWVDDVYLECEKKKSERDCTEGGGFTGRKCNAKGNDCTCYLEMASGSSSTCPVTMISNRGCRCPWSRT